MNPVGNTGPTYSVNRAAAKPAATPAAPTGAPVRGSDKVELSSSNPVSQMLKTLKAGGDFRADKVAAIKAQIAQGTYDDDQKLDAATDKLLDDLLK
jgi:negative regulator of flagellin synthesis FlgM